MKHYMLLLCVLVLSTGTVYAQYKIHSIGIIDVNEVYAAYYRESLAIQVLEQEKVQYQKQLNQYLDEIALLREKRIAAIEDGKQAQQLQLETQIREKVTFIQEFKSVKEAVLRKRSTELTQSDEFIKQLYRAIEQVAEKSGFSLILSKNDPKIQWYSQGIDISDKVIAALKSFNN